MSAWNVNRQQALPRQFMISGIVALAACLAALPASGQVVPAIKPLPPTDPPGYPSRGTKSAFTLNTPELQIQYRLQRDKKSGIVSVASAVPSPNAIAIAWDPNAGPVPENPVLVQIGFDLNLNNTKILATYTTTTPVPAQGPLWSVDVTDVVKKLVDDINNILSPNYDPNTSSFPLDLSATVKVILVQKCTPQYGPVTTIKGLPADVINSPIKVTPVLTIGDQQ